LQAEIQFLKFYVDTFRVLKGETSLAVDKKKTMKWHIFPRNKWTILVQDPYAPPPCPPATSFFPQCGVSKNSTHAEAKQLRLQPYKTQNAVCLQIVKQESGIADGSVFVVFFFSGETLFFQWLRKRPLLECRNSRCTSRNEEKNSVARLEPVSIFEFCI